LPQTPPQKPPQKPHPDSGKNQIMIAFNNSKGADPDENREIEFIQKIVHIKEDDDDTLHFKFKVQEPIDYKKFGAVASTYYEGTTAVVLVFDPSSQTSFDAVENHFIDISYFNPKKINLPLLLVCNNKTPEKRIITEEQGKALAQKLQIPYHEANTTSYTNVEDIFAFCAREGILKGAIQTNVPQSTSFAMERH
jgi:GTPase SAR1 family protein